MDVKNWRKIEEGVALAKEITLEKRDTWLDEFCANDKELRAEIESLLAFESEAEKFLEKSIAPYTTQILPDIETEFSGKQFGKYKIIKEIGHGGMGAVFLAERIDGEFAQHVALKIVRQTILDSETENRFRRERQILASLNHPNIARLLDGGVSEAGEPFLIMEYIEGETLLEFTEKQSLSIEQRLRLFLKICSAVGFAHRNLIIHRDIKPSNILVTKEGEPKLLDFGLAKILDFDNDPTQTETAFRAMTTAYASPEQIRGENVTTASDIYSLGVVLYELLSGERPFKFENKSFDEILRLISTGDPIKPSDTPSKRAGETRKVRADTNNEAASGQNIRVASAPRISNFASQLKGDLDNIVLMSLRKEPERRYKSVGEFADDIQRHLNGLPVTARPNTFRYRAEKFISRNKVGVSAGAFVFLAIISGLIIALWQANIARRQRDIANQEKIKAERINRFLHEMLSFSNQSLTSVSPVAQTKNVTVNEMLDEIAPRVEAELADQPDVRAQILRTIGSAYASQGIFEKAEKNYRSALETQIQIFGEDNAETADTMSELGVLSYRQNKLQEANAVLEKAIAFYRKQREMKSPEFSPAKLALAMDYLGVVKYYLGDLTTAASIMSEAMQIATDANLQGNDRATFLFIKADYGGFLLTTGKPEGEALIRESLAEQSQIYQKPRWERAASLMMLGMNSINKNQFDEALQFLLESEQLFRVTLGDKNGYLANNLQRQAVVYSQKQDFKTAEAKARESMTILEEMFPTAKNVSALPRTSVGIILSKDNRFSEAESYLREGLQGLEQAPVKNHLAIVQAKITLSEGLMARNQLAEAEQLALQAHEEARQNLGEQNPYVKMAAGNLVKIYEKQGKKDLAAKYK